MNREGPELPVLHWRRDAPGGAVPPERWFHAMQIGQEAQIESGSPERLIIVVRFRTRPGGPSEFTGAWSVGGGKRKGTKAYSPRAVQRHVQEHLQQIQADSRAPCPTLPTVAREKAVSERTAAATATFRPGPTSVLLRCTANQSGLGVGVPVEIVGVDPSDHGDPIRTMVTVRLPWGEEDKFQARDLCNEDLSPIMLDRLPQLFAQRADTRVAVTPGQTSPLKEVHLAALRRYRDFYGRYWKSCLRAYWAIDLRPPMPRDTALIQRVKVILGTKGLAKLKL